LGVISYIRPGTKLARLSELMERHYIVVLRHGFCSG
jgi:hypothetical protein